MSRTYSAMNDKHQNQSKTDYQAYFINPNEPREQIKPYMMEEFDDDLLENSDQMREKIRHLARKLRNRRYA